MEKTRMYFCKEPDGGELAVLVDQANGQKVTVYAHDGQHSDADVEYVKTCEPLSKPEESDLYKELVGQGYSDIEVVKKFKDDAATETPVDECVNKMVESVIGGSPICESVKKLASVIFEGMVVPEYENDIYTDELEGGDYLDSSMATDEDRLQDKYGTHMNIVGDEIVRNLDPKVRAREDHEDRRYDEFRKYMMTDDNNVDNDAVDNELNNDLFDILPRYSDPHKVIDAAYEDITDGIVRQLDTSNYDRVDIYDLVRSLLKDHYRIVTVPVKIYIKSDALNSVVLNRHRSLIKHSPKLHLYYATIYLPLMEGYEYDWIVPACHEESELRELAYSYKQNIRFSPDIFKKYMFDIYGEYSNDKALHFIESEIDRVRPSNLSGDGLEVGNISDTMTPDNKTPEDAYDDFSESHEPDEDNPYSKYESIGDILTKDLSKSPLTESVKKLAKVVFEGIDFDYNDPMKVYEALLDHDLFTQAELDLVTNGWGLNMDTLNTACQVRFGMDADQVLEENA